MRCQSRSCWRATSKRTASAGGSRYCSNRAMSNARLRVLIFRAKAGASPPASTGCSGCLPFAQAADRDRPAITRSRLRFQTFKCALLTIGLQSHRDGDQERRDNVEGVAVLGGCSQSHRGLVVCDESQTEHEAQSPPAAPGERRHDNRPHYDQETERRKYHVERAVQRGGDRTVATRLRLFRQIGTRPFGSEGSMLPG